MKQRYSTPVLYNGNGVSIVLEYSQPTFNFAVTGPSAKRPGGSTTKRIPIFDTDVGAWCEIVWDAPDAPDYALLLVEKTNEAEGLKAKVTSIQGNLDLAIQQLQTAETLRLQYIKSIESLKRIQADQEARIAKLQKDLDAAKKKR